MKQSRFRSKRFDELYATASAEMDPEKRLDIMQKMAQYYHEEAPCIFLFHPSQTYGIKKELKGFMPRADRVIWFDTMSLSE
jgi:peptide/nickel transport system substrate-binding protein